MRKSLISIIVPIYNTEKWLRRCVDSILAQSYADFELLLVDDGSTDRSGAICDEYAASDNRIIALHKQNGGVASARNFGLGLAKSDWIMYVDGDDWLEADAIQLLIEKASEKDYDIVFTDFWFDYSDRRVVGHTYDWNKQGNEGLNEYLSTPWTCVWGNIHKKRLYSDNNLRSPEGIKYCEDFHLIIRLCFFADKIAKISKPLYHYRQQGYSVMHNLSKKTEADEQLMYVDTIEFFKQQGIYNEFKQAMAWRTLKASQDLALYVNTFGVFQDYNPDKKDFILTCPFIGKKLKIIMWCLTHNMSWIAALVVRARHALGR